MHRASIHTPFLLQSDLMLMKFVAKWRELILTVVYVICYCWLMPADAAVLVIGVIDDKLEASVTFNQCLQL